MSAAASLEVLRAAGRTAVPWKNGGGLTREVAVHPPGSDFGTFDWRVSIAEVTSAGPFSVFPGIDRCMAVLAGRLALAIDGHEPLTLTPESPAVAFAGDVPAAAEPQGGPVTDLNVMTRRGRCKAGLTRCELREPTRLEPQRSVTRVLVALASQTFVLRGGRTELGRLDALLLAPDNGAVIVAADGAASFLLAELRPA